MPDVWTLTTSSISHYPFASDVNPAFWQGQKSQILWKIHLCLKLFEGFWLMYHSIYIDLPHLPSFTHYYVWTNMKLLWVCPLAYLVGGLEHEFYFPIYWVANHPNWRSYFSEGWPWPTNQIFMEAFENRCSPSSPPAIFGRNRQWRSSYARKWSCPLAWCADRADRDISGLREWTTRSLADLW